jgi:putative DNA primase/helicase
MCKWRDASTANRETVKATFPENASIGVDCGKSGLVVFDLDVHNGQDGRGDWEQLKRDLGFEDGEACVTQTPSGGRHIIFTDPTGGLIGNSDKMLPDSIDVRGNGGYIVAPPSRSEDGQYRWLRQNHPPGHVPPQLVKLLLNEPKPVEQKAHKSSSGKNKYANAALQDEIDELSKVAEGGRNNQLNTSAFNLGQLVGAGVLDRHDVEAALYGACSSNGLIQDDGELSVGATMQSGLNAGVAQPRAIPNRPELTARAKPEKPVTDEEFLLTVGANDEGNAHCVNRLRGGDFLYCGSYGWLFWTGAHWERLHAKEHLQRATVEVLKHRRILAVTADNESVVKAAAPTAHRVRSAMYLFRSLRLAPVASFDSDPSLLNVRNGVLDLRTGQLTPHDPSQRFTYVIDVDYDPDADQSLWLGFLNDALGGDQEMMDYLQEAVGYSLTGYTWEECMFYIYGPTRAGKGVFTETILALMGGKPLATEVDFSTFTSRRSGDTQNFDLAPLKPCRFVAASESTEYSKLNSAVLKRLTGGNDIYCAFKHKDHFTYRPQFKVWLSSNYPVKADPSDDAVWYRVHVIEFPNSYAGNEDKSLKKQLKETSSLKGVLAWAVEGARIWFSHGSNGLQRPRQVEEATQKHRDDQDYVQQWLDECIVDKEDNFIPNGVLHQAYRTWCDEVGRTPKGIGTLTSALKKKGYEAGVQKWHNGRNGRGCIGIEFRTATPPGARENLTPSTS